MMKTCKWCDKPSGHGSKVLVINERKSLGWLTTAEFEYNNEVHRARYLPRGW